MGKVGKEEVLIVRLIYLDFSSMDAGWHNHILVSPNVHTKHGSGNGLCQSPKRNSKLPLKLNSNYGSPVQIKIKQLISRMAERLHAEMLGEEKRAASPKTKARTINPCSTSGTLQEYIL